MSAVTGVVRNCVTVFRPLVSRGKMLGRCALSTSALNCMSRDSSSPHWETLKEAEFSRPFLHRGSMQDIQAAVLDGKASNVAVIGAGKTPFTLPNSNTPDKLLFTSAQFGEVYAAISSSPQFLDLHVLDNKPFHCASQPIFFAPLSISTYQEMVNDNPQALATVIRQETVDKVERESHYFRVFNTLDHNVAVSSSVGNITSPNFELPGLFDRIVMTHVLGPACAEYYVQDPFEHDAVIASFAAALNYLPDDGVLYTDSGSIAMLFPPLSESFFRESPERSNFLDAVLDLGYPFEGGKAFASYKWFSWQMVFEEDSDMSTQQFDKMLFNLANGLSIYTGSEFEIFPVNSRSRVDIAIRKVGDLPRRAESVMSSNSQEEGILRSMDPNVGTEFRNLSQIRESVVYSMPFNYIQISEDMSQGGSAMSDDELRSILSFMENRLGELTGGAFAVEALAGTGRTNFCITRTA